MAYQLMIRNMSNLEVKFNTMEDNELMSENNKKPWINKDLFSSERKDKEILNFDRNKRETKLNAVPRTEVYNPIRYNEYYTELRNRGLDKDDILCGVHEKTIKINKILFDCFTASDLKNNERQLFLWVLSRTTGYNRREVLLDVKKIADDIRRSRTFVYTALNSLCKRNMIYITKKENRLSIYLNTMPNTWSVKDNIFYEIIDESANTDANS